MPNHNPYIVVDLTVEIRSCKSHPGGTECITSLQVETDNFCVSGSALCTLCLLISCMESVEHTVAELFNLLSHHDR